MFENIAEINILKNEKNYNRELTNYFFRSIILDFMASVYSKVFTSYFSFKDLSDHFL